MNNIIIKIITISSLALMPISPFAMMVSQPNTVIAAEQKTKNVEISIYKYSENHSDRSKSMVETYVSKNAEVAVENGKVKQLIIHVNNSKNSYTDVIESLKINGISGHKENISNNGYDFVFSNKAFKNDGWAKMNVDSNLKNGTNEQVWIKFGKVSSISNLEKVSNKRN